MGPNREAVQSSGAGKRGGYCRCDCRIVRGNCRCGNCGYLERPDRLAKKIWPTTAAFVKEWGCGSG